MNRMRLRKLTVIATAGALGLLLASPAFAQRKPDKLSVTVGQSLTHIVPSGVKTVSIANADIADVVVAGPSEILLNGKEVGMTTLVVWDHQDFSTIFDVVVRGQWSEHKIELQVQLAEVDHSVAKEYGLDYLFNYDGSKDDFTGGLYPGDVATPSMPLAIFDGQAVEGADGAFRWTRTGKDLTTMVRALASKGAIRLLAEPNVVAASGTKASFLSGGEIPVPVASSGATGGSTVTIEWKEFGVKVDFLPTIIDEDLINLQVAPEVSSLDFSNGIDLSGFRIPALRSRKAVTTVELRAGETLVIGGLIMEQESVVESRIPVLGDIPLLGYLFRSKETQRSINELMLVVSPKIVRSLPAGTTVELPTDRPVRPRMKDRATLDEEARGEG
jgi:pilus assembly protein CpaC